MDNRNNHLNDNSNINSITSSIGSLSITESPLRSSQSNFVNLSTAVDDSILENGSFNDNQTLNNSSIVDYCVGARVMRGPDWYV